MKKLLYLLLTVTLFASCSSDDNEPTQDYTSFVFYQPMEIDVNFPNCVAAYKKEGKYYKIADLGDLSKGKYSPEIIINDKSIKEIYLFSDYFGCIRFDDTYHVTENKKNTLVLVDGTKGIRVLDKNNPAEYPN